MLFALLYSCDDDKRNSFSFFAIQADYAMKYKAGIAPPRPKGPKRVSEYQMQFKWKDGKQSSPLLAAEQVRYSLHQGIISWNLIDF